MSEIINEQSIIDEQTQDEMFGAEIADESLEAAAFAANLGGAYTEFAYCTRAVCPGG